MAITVSPITHADIDGAITCIQRAFADDPYANWVFNRAHFSAERNSVSLGLRCRWGMKHALFHVAKEGDKVVGVACWLAPTNARDPESWYSSFGSWHLWFQQGLMNLRYGRGGLNVKRYWIWKAAQASAQKELWRDEKGYYFCNIVTVLPDAQGKGIGKKLMEYVMDVADAEGRKCYLESSRAEPNMAIYEKMGFKLAKEMTCDDDGITINLYCMIREPQTRK